MAKHKNTKLHEVECNCIAFFYSVIYFIHENKMQMIPPKYPERAREAGKILLLYRLSFKSVSARTAKKPAKLVGSIMRSNIEGHCNSQV